MRKVIYVLSHGGKWKVQCEHCGDEIKDTQYKAISFGKETCRVTPSRSSVTNSGAGRWW